jgi:hypothetical protein
LQKTYVGELAQLRQVGFGSQILRHVRR